jgi:N4-gp56 family major capsid protein
MSFLSGLMPTSLPVIASVVIPFLFKLVGAVALWIAGGWCIKFALRILRRSLSSGTLDPTVIGYLINILGAVLRVILVVAILGFFGIQTASFAALLAGAGVILYAGAAVSKATITGEVNTTPDPDVPASIVSYRNLMRLDQILTDNRCPTSTTIITGSRMVDTKVIGATRVMFVGSELVPLLKGMKDLFDEKAFIEVQHYGDAGTLLNGEVGSIDKFRIVQVPEMLHWAGAGATATAANPGYRTTNVSGTEKYNVYPMLVVGEDSFTTIGFQTDGKSVKFNVMTKMPGKETADRNDPYGETGFSSIKWYYGFLVKRPERLGMILTVAPV